MSQYDEPVDEFLPTEQEVPPPASRASQPVQRRTMLPWVLFLATCLTTYSAGGLAFAVPVMFILLCHEMGHFLQARRYHVPASYPYFIPMPIGPIGTMGAVIGMHAHVGDRKALFDIAITGPLAGLVPTLVCCVVGLHVSTIIDTSQLGASLMLGEPLIFKGLSYLVFGSLGEHQDILLHPIAFAGWVGLFVTALNLVPIGQLDGGHILYSLLRRKAHPVATGLLIAAIAAVVLAGYWGWSLMIMLLVLMGAKHPPTADDNAPLGPVRPVLGWLMLLFVPLGFTPTPFFFQ
jgi:membrane-associated protease RseP (regulator of RpoE activity)